MEPFPGITKLQPTRAATRCAMNFQMWRSFFSGEVNCTITIALGAHEGKGAFSLKDFRYQFGVIIWHFFLS
jgi:hypothetical protein